MAEEKKNVTETDETPTEQEMAEPATETEVEAAAPDTEDEPSEAASEESPGEGEAEPVAAEAEPVAEPEVSAEAVAEAPEEAEEPAEQPAEEAGGEGETQAAEAAVAAPKTKKKRLPRSQRPPRTKKKRETAAARKPITRLPKGEHVRGRRQERQGTVVSAATDKTIVVRVDVVKVHPTYKKVIKRSTKLHAHDERNEAKPGDIVRIVETRPLSKLKRWRLQEIVEAAK